MGLLNLWIDSKLAEIANKLPALVYQDAASFSCGYNAGYKQAVLDLERHLEGMAEILEKPLYFDDIYNTHEQIMEAMQWQIDNPKN